MAPHQYQQSGPLRVRMEDGTEIEAGKLRHWANRLVWRSCGDQSHFRSPLGQRRKRLDGGIHPTRACVRPSALGLQDRRRLSPPLGPFATGLDEGQRYQRHVEIPNLVGYAVQGGWSICRRSARQSASAVCCRHRVELLCPGAIQLALEPDRVDSHWSSFRGEAVFASSN
jgi:hypothetical protein